MLYGALQKAPWTFKLEKEQKVLEKLLPPLILPWMIHFLVSPGSGFSLNFPVDTFLITLHCVI